MVLHEIYRVADFVIKIVGISTVLRGIFWLYRRRQQNTENRVLDALRPQCRQWHWQSGRGVVARMRRDLFLFMAEKHPASLFSPRIDSRRSFASWLRAAPARLGYFYDRKFVIPSERKANNILRELWKRGLLVCPRENSTLYQLKHS